VADGVDLVAAEVIIHEAAPLDPAEAFLASRLPFGVWHLVDLLGSGSPMGEEIGWRSFAQLIIVGYRKGQG
jgi:hypothetical protein